MKFLRRTNKAKLQLLNSEIHKQGFKLEGEVKDSIAGRGPEPTSVDTGRFLNSVRTDNSKKLMSVVRTDIFYSKFLEYGTSRIRARRHFQNSSNRRKPIIVKAIKKAIAK